MRSPNVRNLQDFELVAVDLDGVLIDTASISLRVCSEVAAKYGYDVKELSEKKSLIGRPTSEIIKEIEKLTRVAVTSDMKDEIYSITKKLELNPRLFSDSFTFVNALPRQRALVSNGNLENTIIKLRNTGLEESFKGAVFTRSTVERPKPAPDVYISAIEAFGADPKKSIAVEDSEVGVTAAKEAGLQVVAVVHDEGLRNISSDALLNAGAEMVAPSLISALKYLDGDAES